MSVDIYLLPLQPLDDFEAAMDLRASLDSHPQTGPNGDVREAAEVITRMDGRYTPFEKDYAAIAAYEKTTEDEARQRYDHVELNGIAADGAPLAQMIFYRNRAVIHWYSGTAADEIKQYVTRHPSMSSRCGRRGDGVQLRVQRVTLNDAQNRVVSVTERVAGRRCLARNHEGDEAPGRRDQGLLLPPTSLRVSTWTWAPCRCST